MKKMFLAVLVAVMVIFSVNNIVLAAGEKESSAFELSAGIDYYSAYIGSLTGAESYDGSVLQPSFTVTHKKTGLYFSAWGSYPLAGSMNSDNGGSEIDLVLGITENVGPVKVDAYYAFYNVYSLTKWGNGDIHALGLKLEWPINEIFVPYVMAEYDYAIGQSELSGLAYRAGLKMKLHEHLELDLSGAGHTAMFDADKEELSSGKIAVRIPFEYWGISITPEVNYQMRFGYKPLEPDEELVPGQERKVGFTEGKLWYGLKLAYTF